MDALYYIYTVDAFVSDTLPQISFYGTESLAFNCRRTIEKALNTQIPKNSGVILVYNGQATLFKK